MLLTVRGLAISFGGVRAVDNVDWDLEEGQIHCIIGPNGAGKSTFFKLLMGSLRPDHGSILLDGTDITRTLPFERVSLGLAIKPQTLGVFSNLTVSDNLRIALIRRADAAGLDTAIDRELHDLRLSSKRDFLVRELSHGERQWLSLGMAAGSKPRLLLLDEPTAGMSPEETRRTVEIIRQLSTTGMATVVVEHDMAFVRDLAAPLTVFHEGRVFARGSLAEIERHEDVRRLYLGGRGAMQLRSEAGRRS